MYRVYNGKYIYVHVALLDNQSARYEIAEQYVYLTFLKNFTTVGKSLHGVSCLLAIRQLID